MTWNFESAPVVDLCLDPSGDRVWAVIGGPRGPIVRLEDVVSEPRTRVLLREIVFHLTRCQRRLVAYELWGNGTNGEAFASALNDHVAARQQLQDVLQRLNDQQGQLF